jgi:sugar O-acyltransferase (sialic acid O-acetyltransferase NeuD family)
MSKMVIFGTGEFAQVAAVYLDADSPHQVVAFTVDGARRDQEQVMGRPVVPFEELTRSHPPGEYELFVAIGFKGLNQARAEVFGRVKAAGYTCISYVCSRAMQWGHVTVGENSFVFESNVLQPFVRIGDNTILWSGNHVGHHATIGSHCFITSHVVISGGTTVGDYCFVGVNATLGDHITIAPRCLIGAGAMVLRSTEENSAYVGVSAEKAKRPANTLRGFTWEPKAA